jgi:small subunit ribosomal protein S2
MKIPVIALTDTNANPELVDYAIPANDDAVSSIEYIYGIVAKVINEAKSKRVIASKIEKVSHTNNA